MNDFVDFVDLVDMNMDDLVWYGISYQKWLDGVRNSIFNYAIIHDISGLSKWDRYSHYDSNILRKLYNKKICQKTVGLFLIHECNDNMVLSHGIYYYEAVRRILKQE